MRTHAATALTGQRVVVMGLGSFGGGAGAVRYLCKAGARVTVTDLRAPERLADGLAAIAGLDLELVLGEHRERDFRSCDVVVANPAVRPDDPHLALARRHGARIVSEVELFLERTPSRVVAVTGTQGKSSTTAMVAQLLGQGGHDVRLGGNIGGSLLPEVDRLTAETVCVLELSSYQLEALSVPGDGPGLAGCAQVVAVTNVLADHLERHGTREAYARAKARILELVDASGHAILPEHDAFSDLELATPARVARVGRELALVDGAFMLEGEHLGDVADLRLAGDFQRENALVALGAARRMGVAAATLAAGIADLRGLEHRLEDLGTVRGHRVWDNGVSTTPDSTASALTSVRGTCVLLCGGRYKETLPLDELIERARGHVSRAVTFGESAALLAARFEAGGVRARACPDLGSALEAAFESAQPGDALLFSPGCASFDAYANFQERAREFRARIEAMQ